MARKPKQSPVSDAPKAPQQPSPELLGKVQTLRALATCHNLLLKGMYPYGHHLAIEASIKFITSLHEQVLADALSLPDAHLVPELQAATQPKGV